MSDDQRKGVTLFFVASKTPPPAPPVVGGPYKGGYYAGLITAGNDVYELIVSPKNGGESSLAVKTSRTSTGGAMSVNDGMANTVAMMNVPSGHPAASFCSGLDIGGYDDWYMPSNDELEVLYRVFKPTVDVNNTTDNMTLAHAPVRTNGYNPNSIPPGAGYLTNDPLQTEHIQFQAGGAEAFEARMYWSSTHASAQDSYGMQFFSGTQIKNFKNGVGMVRAVRREKVEQ